jgi:hypothetical protein
MLSVGFEASEMIEIPPMALPAEAGVKVTAKVALCPTANENGDAGPLRVKASPAIVACATFTLEPPEFITVTDCVTLPPT